MGQFGALGLVWVDSGNAPGLWNSLTFRIGLLFHLCYVTRMTFRIVSWDS